MLKQLRRRWIARAIPMATALLLLAAGSAGGELQHLRHHLEGCEGDAPQGASHDPWDAHGICVACQIFHHGWVDLTPAPDVAVAAEANDHAIEPQRSFHALSLSHLPSVRGPPASRVL